MIDNNTLAMITWEQMVMDGNPELGTELSPIASDEVREVI